MDTSTERFSPPGLDRAAIQASGAAVGDTVHVRALRPTLRPAEATDRAVIVALRPDVLPSGSVLVQTARVWRRRGQDAYAGSLFLALEDLRPAPTGTAGEWATCEWLSDHLAAGGQL